MALGEVLLSSLSSGVITQDEVASALRFGRLIDTGNVNLGCRLPLAIG